MVFFSQIFFNIIRLKFQARNFGKDISNKIPEKATLPTKSLASQAGKVISNNLRYLHAWESP